MIITGQSISRSSVLVLGGLALDIPLHLERRRLGSLLRFLSVSSMLLSQSHKLISILAISKIETISTEKTLIYYNEHRSFLCPDVRKWMV